MGAGARLARAVRRRGCRGGAVAAGRIRRGPRGRVGRGAAVRLLRPGAGGRAVPPGSRPRYLGLGRVGRARADDFPGQAVARQRHLGAARDAGPPAATAGRARTRRRRASGASGYSPRSRPRWPRRGRRPSGRRPGPRQWRWGDVHQAVRVHPLGGGGRSRPAPGVPMGGDADTIQAAGYGWRAGGPFTVASLSVYRQVVDLADGRVGQLRDPGRRVRRPGQPALRRPARASGRPTGAFR